MHRQGTGAGGASPSQGSTVRPPAQAAPRVRELSSHTQPGASRVHLVPKGAALHAIQELQHPTSRQAGRQARRQAGGHARPDGRRPFGACGLSRRAGRCAACSACAVACKCHSAPPTGCLATSPGQVHCLDLALLRQASSRGDSEGGSGCRAGMRICPASRPATNYSPPAARGAHAGATCKALTPLSGLVRVQVPLTRQRDTLSSENSRYK